MNVFIGSLNYDIILFVDRMPTEHEKMTAKDRLEACGGSAANTAHWMARLGHPVEFYGAVGDDVFGHRCVQALSNVNIDRSGVQIINNATTKLQVILIAPNSKRMIGSGTAHAMFDENRLENIAIRPGEILHFQARDHSKLATLIQRIRTTGAIVSCEANGADCRPLLHCVDYVFMNHDELRNSLAGEGDPFDVLSRLLIDAPHAHVVVTQGKTSATLITSGRKITRPGFPVEPLDRTGGGDAFNAAFLSAILRGKSYEHALSDGLMLASAVIQHLGPRPQIALPSQLVGTE